MIDEDFRTLLLSFLPVGTLVEKGKISMEAIPSRVYFQRQTGNGDPYLSGRPGSTDTTFDVEVAVLDDDAAAQAMAASLLTGLDGYPFNGAAVLSNLGAAILGIETEGHSDEYSPLIADLDAGYMVSTFQATVHHHS